MSGWTRAWVVLSVLSVWGGSVLVAGDDGDRPESDPTGRLRRTMRELRSEALRPPSRARSGRNLQEAGEKVRRLQLRPGQRPVEPPATSPPGSQPASAPASPARKAPVSPLSPEVLQQIVKLPPKQVADPSALADELFLAGRERAAFTFYEQALRSAQSPESKAWVLYQMATCRRKFDPPGARKLYARLLAEHPTSAWQPLAVVQDRLIEWYQTNDPAALLMKTKVNE